jgi:hypothetical protein
MVDTDVRNFKQYMDIDNEPKSLEEVGGSQMY